MTDVKEPISARTSEELKFGTSGVRGLASLLEGIPAFSYCASFLQVLLDREEIKPMERVLLACDLRASSPQILQMCAAGVAAAGLRPVDCGAIPTPALALAAMREKVVAIMVTGSHIPEDRNGLKFYRASGEIDKKDEAAIAALESSGTFRTPSSVLGSVEKDDSVRGQYKTRYRAFFKPSCLSGLRVGVWQHSSVARDLLAEILSELGASLVPFGRSNKFIPVDTEAHRPEDLEALRRFAAEHDIDAIVSTDGDADRPMVADAAGKVVRGDLLGLLAADFLGLHTVVTPVTSSAAIEGSGIAARVLRTKVGSPFVIAGMEEMIASGRSDVIGFEANGGVLQASPVQRDGRMLAPLPTRDAVLPIVCALAHARKHGLSLAGVVARLGAGYPLADRLKEIPAERSRPLLTKLAGDETFAAAFLAEAGNVASSSSVDGVRFVMDDGSTIHFRASGNAPEFRCYVEAGTHTRAEQLLRLGLSKAAAAMR